MSKRNLCILTDIHGSYRTMLALIERAKQEWGDFDLYSLGDEIDRGPRSREVVEYMMENKVPCVLANHTDLCLAYSRHATLGYRAKCTRYYDRDVWLRNGGDKSLESWGFHGGSGTLPRNVLDWMSSLPPYIIPDVEPDENGRRLLLGHTGYGLDADKNNWMRALWGRYPGDGEFAYEPGTGKPMDDGYFRVYGHSPLSEVTVFENRVNIDAGAAYRERGYGNMTAFHWPSKQYIMQATID